MLMCKAQDFSHSGNQLPELHNHRYIELISFKFCKQNCFKQLSKLTSFFPKGDFLYQILSSAFCLCLLSKKNEDSGSFISAG